MSESGLGSPAAVSTPSRLSLFLDRAGLQGFPWVSAIVLYTISWGWLLVVGNSYWAADWEVYVIPELTTFDFGTLGLAPWINTYVLIHDIVGAFAMRMLIFLFYFLASVFLFGILKEFKFVSFWQKKFIVIFFLILPFNTAKIALMVFHYSVAYFLFFFAWYCLTLPDSFLRRALSTIAFFLSFSMHSLLFFFAIPIYLDWTIKHRLQKLTFLQWIKRNLFFLSLPLLYFVLRNNFWPETISYHNLSKVSVVMPFVILVVPGFLFLVYSLSNRDSAKSRSNERKMISFGLATILLGLLPYILHGFFKLNSRLPLDYLTVLFGRTSWYTRHQTLQPLGAGFFLFGLISLTKSNKRLLNADYLASGAIFACLILNLGFGLEHKVDYEKQKRVVQSLKSVGHSDLLVNYVFIDQATSINARGQVMYERAWSGLIWQAYGLGEATTIKIGTNCSVGQRSRLVLIQGPETQWQALKNWVRDRDMGFKVTIDDTPGACKPEMVTAERVFGAIPILFYFTGAKN